jgi:glycine/D-amino acid oxidase-like deaminating enzyme
MNSAPRAASIDPIAGDYWLSSSGDDLRLRPRLERDLTVDVAILGGGFSGLWTAYHLLRMEPSLDIAVVERRFCGYGASGRNGGWCSPRFPVDTGPLIRRVGADMARRTILALQATVEDVGGLLREEGIDAHYRRTGLLSIARTEGELDGLRAALALFDTLDLTGNRLISAEEAYERVHVTSLCGALATDQGATVHPARLVRGLARAVERRGATIFEQTHATAVRTGADAAIVTDGGVLRARRAVVTAGEAYLTGLPDFHRQLLPMSSMIVLTAPLTPAQWERVGWDGYECLSSQAHTKNYLTRTADGRFLYGSRGAPYHFASGMSEDALQDEATFEWMRQSVRSWWPGLSDVEFTHAWGGYLGVPRDWMPSVGFDPETRLAQLYGYTGRGVSTTAMCGRLLAGLIGGKPTGLEDLPFHRRRAPRWEIEPFRWAAVRYLQNAYGRIDEADGAGRKPPIDAGFAEWLGGQ